MSRFARLATSLFVFLLYSNALVVAKNFHGAPSALAIAATGLLLPAIILRLWRDASLRLSPAAPAILIFVLVGGVSAWWAGRPDIAVNHFRDVLLEGVLLYFFLINAIDGRQDLEAYAWAILAGAGMMGAIVGHQYATGSFDSNYGGFAQIGALATEGDEVERVRLAGPNGEQNRFAQVLALSVPLALTQFLGTQRRALKNLALAAAGLALAGCALTLSRGVIVGMIPFLIVAIAIGVFRLRHVVLVAALAGVLSIGLPQVRDRVRTLGSISMTAIETGSTRNTDPAVRGRLTELQAALFIFIDNPVLGIGPECIRTRIPNSRSRSEARSIMNSARRIASSPHRGGVWLLGTSGNPVDAHRLLF